MRARNLCFIFLLTLVSICQAQSPYQYNFKKEAIIVGSGLGLNALGLALKHSRGTSVSEANLHLYTPDKVNAFDRGATKNFNTTAGTISDILRNGTIVLPALLLIPKNTRKDILNLALLTFEVVALNYGVTSTTKNAIHRVRPYVYNEEVSTTKRTNDQGKLSFYSGHVSHTTAVSVMMAKILIDYNPDMKRGTKILLWSGAFAYSGTTAVTRVLAGDHFPTDVITGAALGGLIGYLIPHLHKRSTSISLTSYKLEDANGVTFNYTF